MHDKQNNDAVEKKNAVYTSPGGALKNNKIGCFH